VLPRMIGALYTLRNKRSGGHTASEVDPSQADASVAERMADWLMAEIFRLGNSLPPDQAEAAIAALVQRRIPAVYTSGSYRRVLRTDLGPREEVMLLLYGEAAGAAMADLQKWSRVPRTTLDRHLQSLVDDRLIRTQVVGGKLRAYLLPPGERRVELEGWLEPE
jgi:hypothetical protein